jgi:hypothetical protein
MTVVLPVTETFAFGCWLQCSCVNKHVDRLEQCLESELHAGTFGTLCALSDDTN